MANITAAMVKELREASGAGMMECKKALTEADGNMEAAMDILKKSGAAKVEKKASRIAAEGIARVASEGNTAVVLEVNSETDFVAKNEVFQEFVQEMANKALKASVDKAGDGEDLVSILGVKADLDDATLKIGEKLSLRRFEKVTGDVVASYIHGGGKIGVLVAGVGASDDAAKEAGVPMVGFDTEVADMSYLVSYTGSDNYNAGKVCGEDLVKKCPNGGDIIVLDSPTMQSVVDRTNGFLDAIDGKGFNVVAQQDAKGNLEVAMGIAEDLLQAHGDVVAIFGGNDPTALGALAAANAAGIKDCKIYGVDGSPDIKAELASGDSLIEGTGAQSPVSIAKKAVQIMYDYMDGKTLEDRYPVETFLITADNVNDYGVDGWQ